MNDTPQMVALDEADIHSLRHYANVTLGLEVAASANGPTLRAKIKKADASTEEIPMFIPEGEGTPRANPVSGPLVSGAVKEPVATANGVDLAAIPVGSAPGNPNDPMHHSNDPRAVIEIMKTDDKRRSRDVDVSVNGVTFRMQRQKRITVPYRVYETLMAAQEKAPVDGDEINPATGEPVKIWADIESYPFRVHALPSQEEIAEWREKTSKTFQQAAA